MKRLVAPIHALLLVVNLVAQLVGYTMLLLEIQTDSGMRDNEQDHISAPFLVCGKRAAHGSCSTHAALATKEMR